MLSVDSQAVVLYEESQMVRRAAEDMGVGMDEYRKKVTNGDSFLIQFRKYIYIHEYS